MIERSRLERSGIDKSHITRGMAKNNIAEEGEFGAFFGRKFGGI